METRKQAILRAVVKEFTTSAVPVGSQALQSRYFVNLSSATIRSELADLAEAGYLAQVFPHVYVDAGLATHNLGARAPALLAEALELAPFGKFLYSSDAFGLPELYYLGAALFRSALSAFLRSGLEEDLFTERTAARLARMLGADNAKRAYQLGDQM